MTEYCLRARSATSSGASIRQLTPAVGDVAENVRGQRPALPGESLGMASLERR